jgi:hypothetical protein
MPKAIKEIAQDKDVELEDIKSDSYGKTEQKKIVKMVVQDILADEAVAVNFFESRKLALQHYNSEKPSILEGITIKGWQSDVNLGAGAAVADSYQSTLSATCWNPDSIHYVANEENDIDNKDNLEQFTKWMIGTNEVNAEPEVDDYIHNKITQGFSIFEIYREVWFEWVDRRIPIKGKDGLSTGGYTTKTEKVRFEKAVLENVDNLDDILMPRYGDQIQKLPHIMRIIHLTGDKLLEYGDQGQFENVDAKFVARCKTNNQGGKNGIEEEKGKQLDLEDVVDDDYRAMPIDVYKWYGWYTKNGKRERYRFIVERETETFLSGKPLRKIMRIPKYPFVGGPFERIPGQLRGKDLLMMIKDPVNAINRTFNQKSDFQYVTNCPFGFHKAGEGYTKSNYDLMPGVNYVTEGNPSEEMYFPNIQRSMAWAESDIRILFEVIEKRTGAASFFSSQERNATGTATRDMIVEKNSETRFGKWVKRIQAEIAEAISMCVAIYQDHAPDNLGMRVLGEDGKRLFPNLSIETIRYQGDARMVPDITAGSKAYDRQVKLWAYDALQQSPWFDPRINPKGNWLLVSDTMKSQGIAAPERYLPPMPRTELGTGRIVDQVWQRIMQGEIVEPEENWNVPEILTGLYKKKDEKYFEIDVEYRQNLDDLIFKVEVALRLFMKQVMMEQQATQLAKQAIAQGHGQPMAQPQNVPQGQPAQGNQPLPQAQPQMGGV